MGNNVPSTGSYLLENADHMERLLAQLTEDELKAIFAIAFNLIPFAEYNTPAWSHNTSNTRYSARNQIIKGLALEALQATSLKVLRPKHGKIENGKLVSRTDRVEYLLGGEIAATLQEVYDAGYGFTYNPNITSMYLKSGHAHPVPESIPFVNTYVESIPLQEPTTLE